VLATLRARRGADYVLCFGGDIKPPGARLLSWVDKLLRARKERVKIERYPGRAPNVLLLDQFRPVCDG
jgi:hypothetical protein